MRSLLLYLQIQQGLTDSLYGFVEESTATLLNSLMQTLTGQVATRAPLDLRMLSDFCSTFSVSTNKFCLCFRLVGEIQDRWLSLNPTTLMALLALKAAFKHFVFDPTTKSFIATDDLLR